MPYPMTHLYIAKRVTELRPELMKDLPQYYLGTLSPDSIHFRLSFTANDKKATHLCVGDEKWGEVTNNPEWTESVLSFLRGYKNADGFVLGYCIHILADIYNNISNVWLPYKRKSKPETDKNYGDQYNGEQAAVDSRLAYEFQYKDEVWDMLEKSHSLTIRNIVRADDIDKMKENILHVQYVNTNSDTALNKFYTHEYALKQIEDTALFVLKNI